MNDNATLQKLLIKILNKIIIDRFQAECIVQMFGVKIKF